MKPIFLVCVMLLALGQKELEPTTPETPETIRVLAIHGTDAGRGAISMDPTLTSMEDVLVKLPYDTFREVVFQEVTAAYGADTSFNLGEDYTYHCRPVQLTEEDEVVLEVYVERGQGDSVVEALRATGRLARGKGMIFRGFEMPEGELIIVTSVARAKEESSGGAGGGNDAGDPQAGGGSGSDNSAGMGGKGAEGATDAEMSEVAQEIADEREEEEVETVEERAVPISANSVEEGEALPPELANLEGILSALEEIDEQEQRNARRRELGSTTKGAWW